MKSQINEIEKSILNLFNNRKNKKQNQNNNIDGTPTLVIATNNFVGENYDHLDIKKDEFLIVTDWNYKENGWVYGYHKNNEKEKGIFPKIFIKIYKDENDEYEGNILNKQYFKIIIYI